jgi:hypothetical protein
MISDFSMYNKIKLFISDLLRNYKCDPGVISMAIFITSYKSENSSPKYVRLNFLLCGAQLVGWQGPVTFSTV